MLPLVSHLRRPDGVTEWNKTPALHLLKKEERKKKDIKYKVLLFFK